ncbi:glycosyltransferase family 4 protein, partial [candidate division WOR-3 bacterium]|nr:glycosyltransferase family 4 protein [candidate division WOR-3 bacterium]
VGIFIDGRRHWRSDGFGWKYFKMRIIQIITKLEKGGAQLTVLEIMRKKKNSMLITGKDGVLLPEALKRFKGRVFIAKDLVRNVDPIRDFLALIQIMKTLNKLKKERRCLVHTNSSKAGLLGRWASIVLNIPCVHTVHGWSFNPHQKKIFRNLAIILEKITSYFTSQIVVVTTQDIEKGLEFKIGKKEKYSLARAVTDLDPFRISPVENLRKKLGFPENCPLVGSVSNFKPQKAPLDFIETAEKVVKKTENVIFFIAGGGPLLSKSKKLAKTLGIEDKIFFLGWRDDIPDLMRVMDVFLLVSLWEGLPQVVLQAMAAGKPVVVTAVDGSKEIVINGVNGFLVRPQNPEEAAEKILSLINDEHLRGRIGSQAFKTVERGFSIQEMMEALENVWIKAQTPAKEIKSFLF